ncbi:hypothetical protein [Sphingomicrobium nitratireducens]|uniref:hypothetical protein n=1 Tax=Sphingomicrobium nitratireducens TaxID=2964666 RepID=UPI00223F4CC4|nr:hypothetical protein [Sphingomicrobium nitratireducens]
MAKKQKKEAEAVEEAKAAKAMKPKKDKKKKKAKKAAKEKKAKKVLIAEEIEIEREEEGGKREKAVRKIAELADHPLVADVVAAGAVAAVAALAEKKATSARGVKSGSRDLLKVAGAAAAAAIGKRIKAEMDAARTRDRQDEADDEEGDA